LTLVALLVLTCHACGEGDDSGSGGGPPGDAGGGGGQGDAGGGPPPCTPSDEVCNGRDDDCDGATDEDLGEVSCGVGGCERTLSVCRAGVVSQECTPGQPIMEICNAQDDDCDGETDEADDGGDITRPCYTGPDGTDGVGACRGGARTCQGGDYPQVECPGEVTPVMEEPDNGADEDCDGQTDEGFAALAFQGQPDSVVRYVEPPDDRVLGLQAQSFTVEAWVKPTRLSPYRTNAVVARRAEASGEGWLLAVAGWGGVEGVAPRGLVFLVGAWPDNGAGGAFLASQDGAIVFEDGEWHHVAVWFRHGAGQGGAHAVTLYADGKQVASSDLFAAAPTEPASVPPLWIGADPHERSGTFEGVIGDVRVTLGGAHGLEERACQPGQGCFEPAACLPEGGDAALVHWPLNEGAGGTVHDVSGNGREASVTGRPEARWLDEQSCLDRR